MDFAGVGALLGSLKTATEIAKFIKDSDLTIEKAENKLRIAELISALADVKLEAAEVQQALLERDERIRELEREAQVVAAVKWIEPCYWIQSSDEVSEPYCQHCYDNSKKLARLHSDTKGLYQCRVCDKNFITRERLEHDAAALRESNARRRISRGVA
jgi:hypothetical protein